jgi:hypothetical protein
MGAVDVGSGERVTSAGVPAAASPAMTDLGEPVHGPGEVVCPCCVGSGSGAGWSPTCQFILLTVIAGLVCAAEGPCTVSDGNDMLGLASCGTSVLFRTGDTMDDTPISSTDWRGRADVFGTPVSSPSGCCSWVGRV